MAERKLDVDEHGVVFDDDLPPFVQSDADLRRWEICLGIARVLARAREDTADVLLFARHVYDSAHPTDEPEPVAEGASGQLEVQESLVGAARAEFNRLHPRARAGLFREVPEAQRAGRRRRHAAHAVQRRTVWDGPVPVAIRRAKRTPPPQSPGSVIAKVFSDELLDMPNATPLALEVLHGKLTSKRRFLRKRQPQATPDFDPQRHPVYYAKRAKRHRRIIGTAMYPALRDLLGENHPITRRAKGGFEDGYLTEAERLTVRAAAADARNGAPPQALFMAGGPATGKTTIKNENPSLAPEFAVNVENDLIKEGLPEYVKLRDAHDRYAAVAVHDEAGDIAARMYDEAVAAGLNVVLDGTGNSPPGLFSEELVRAHDSGYEVDVLYVNRPTRDAAAWAVYRAHEEGRLVPLKRLWYQHAAVSRNFRDEIMDLPWARIRIIDFYEGSVAWFHGEAGPPHIWNPLLLDQFVAKADETMPPDGGLTNG